MPKDLALSHLLDVYGSLLSEKQRLLCELYYDEDLSLAEIAENEGITRQGVRDALKKAEQQLHVFEDNLGLLKKTEALRVGAEAVKNGGDINKLYDLIDSF
ncbi:MAG: winged helix-turn-helix transcriptional regulator [Clostridia bacterium]|nr:winged helix-turn-helix transcriptional regulator [Clostridia bacterium]